MNKKQLLLFIVFSSFATVPVIIFLMYASYLFLEGDKNEAVLWCGNTIVDPLVISSNWIIPLGLISHIFVLLYSNKKTLPLNVLHVILFSFVSVCTFALGVYYCKEYLEGRSFMNLLWWGL